MNKDKAFKEQGVHGTLSFPVKIYYPSIIRKLYGLYVHWHNEFEISVVINGKAKYKINNYVYEVKKDDVIIISPGLIHSAVNDFMEDCEHITLVFDLAFLCSKIVDVCSQKYILPVLNGDVFFEPFCQKDAAIKGALEIIKSLYLSQQFGYELTIKKELFVILERIYELNIVKENKLTSEMTLIKNILSDLENNFCEEVYIHQIANKLNYSESHISKSFKAYTGVTIMDYVLNLRLCKAAELLLIGDLNVSETALSVGFNNMSYFSKRFIQKYGVSPKEYKHTAAKL